MNRPFDAVSVQLFVSVCEEGSLARAAERHALVPSALSKRIAALEADAGVPLLQRQRRGVLPTPAGHALLAGAREWLSGMQRVRAELGAFGQGVQGSVRVLASPSVLAEQLPDDIARFLAQHPTLQVSLDERNSADIARSLREGAADLGVMWDAADLQGLQAWPYRGDQLCVAMAPGHPLARRSQLSFAETLDQHSVGVATAGMMERLMQRHAALLGRSLVHRIQVSSMDAACRIVAVGLGLAILPRESAVPHAGAGRLALVPLSDDWARRRFVVVGRGEALLSPAARAMVAHLQAVAGEGAA